MAATERLLISKRQLCNTSSISIVADNTDHSQGKARDQVQDQDSDPDPDSALSTTHKERQHMLIPLQDNCGAVPKQIPSPPANNTADFPPPAENIEPLPPSLQSCAEKSWKKVLLGFGMLPPTRPDSSSTTTVPTSTSSSSSSSSSSSYLASTVSTTMTPPVTVETASKDSCSSIQGSVSVNICRHAAEAEAVKTAQVAEELCAIAPAFGAETNDRELLQPQPDGLSNPFRNPCCDHDEPDLTNLALRAYDACMHLFPGRSSQDEQNTSSWLATHGETVRDYFRAIGSKG